MDVYEAIRTKRATRKFLDKPLSQEAVHTILNAGRLAQSSKNMQAWHFIAIQERETLQSLAACGTYASHLAGAALGVAILTPDPGLRFNVMFDAGQAAAYMQLAAWEMGIGSCLATIYERAQARELLKFPPELHIRIAISFGIPAPHKPHPPRKSGRREFEAVIHSEHWQAVKPVHNPFGES